MRDYCCLSFNLRWFLSIFVFICEQSGPSVPGLIEEYEEIELNYSNDGEKYWNEK